MRKRVEGPNDQRGHPTVTYDEIGIRAFLQQNTGSEQLILGQHVKNYDAFMLTSKQVQIKEGDEIQWHDKIFRVAEIIENRSHIECHLKKVEA
ncbi:MAG: phage head closure protein [Thermoplasmatales archaeon]|nr:phage head closure protein [Thermoplasmatales archaeon]